MRFWSLLFLLPLPLLAEETTNEDSTASLYDLLGIAAEAPEPASDPIIQLSASTFSTSAGFAENVLENTDNPRDAAFGELEGDNWTRFQIAPDSSLSTYLWGRYRFFNESDLPGTHFIFGQVDYTQSTGERSTFLANFNGYHLKEVSNDPLLIDGARTVELYKLSLESGTRFELSDRATTTFALSADYTDYRDIALDARGLEASAEYEIELNTNHSLSAALNTGRQWYRDREARDHTGRYLDRLLELNHAEIELEWVQQFNSLPIEIESEISGERLWDTASDYDDRSSLRLKIEPELTYKKWRASLSAAMTYHDYDERTSRRYQTYQLRLEYELSQTWSLELEATREYVKLGEQKYRTTTIQAGLTAAF